MSDIPANTNSAMASSLETIRINLAELCAEGTDGSPYLNSLEKMSIKALIAFTSYNTGANEAVVLAALETRLGADGVEKILRASYDDAVRYLVDFAPNKMAH